MLATTYVISLLDFLRLAKKSSLALSGGLQTLVVEMESRP
jgi:hypothetical protein